MKPEFQKDKLPRHVAVIMDGNGRWALKQGKSRIIGHNAAPDSVRTITRTSRKLGIEALTLFAFGIDNFSRPKTEVNALFRLLKRYLKSEMDELQDNDIKLKVIGDLKRLPRGLQKQIQEAMQQTSKNKSMVFSIAIGYSGRNDVIQAIQAMGREIKAGNINPEEITEEMLDNFLYTSELPQPDLLIRTGGEQRLSNFFLWQAAYTEIYFSPVLWPDFDEDEYYKILLDFQNRERRFGMTSEQLSEEDEN